jgi:hypothetical protein
MRGRTVSPLVLLVVSAALATADGEGKKPPVLEVGKPAPTFRLNDHTGRGVAIGPGLSKTWVVLAFYPKALTGG